MTEKLIDISKKDAAIFIMPRSSKAWFGAEALWITAAGWSAAAKRKLGNAWVVTQDRIAQPEEVIHYPLVSQSAAPTNTKRQGIVSRLLPMFVKIFLKDLLLYRQSKQWKILDENSWSSHKVAFVWQQHDLFATSGRLLADRLRVPLVIYVHAPVVWETAKWNVKRYLWGRFLERFVEASALKRADIVACVSEEVAQKLVSMGVPSEKVVVSPMAVDQDLFDQERGNELRRQLGLADKKIIGWIGSFRSFHGLDHLVEAFSQVARHVNDLNLVLVGDGQERSALEKLVNDLGIAERVVFTGRQPFAKIPQYVAMFDIAVVSAKSSEGFHYSPLKLREYLAAGKATLAPRAGEIPNVFQDGRHLKIYEAGNVKDLASKLQEMIGDEASMKSLASEGKRYVLETGTWDYELKRITTVKR